MVKSDSTVTFIRKGALKEFFITDSKETSQISFIETARLLECEPEEEKINVGATYYDHFESNNKAFDESLVQEDVIEATKAPLRGNDMKVMHVLRALQNEPTLTEDQEDMIKRLIRAYENGDVPQNVTKAIVKELGQTEDLGETYYVITNQVPDQYLYERKDAVLRTEGDKQVILSCYMKEIK